MPKAGNELLFLENPISITLHMYIKPLKIMAFKVQ